LQSDLSKLSENKIQIIAVSYDSVEVLKKFSNNKKLEFPLLSDPESELIKAFGLLNPDAKGKTQGIPYPGTIILDSKGVIQAKLFFDGYRDRHTSTDILESVARLEGK
jgi:peroxiredoxin